MVTESDAGAGSSDLSMIPSPSGGGLETVQHLMQGWRRPLAECKATDAQDLTLTLTPTLSLKGEDELLVREPIGKQSVILASVKHSVLAPFLLGLVSGLTRKGQASQADR